MLTCDWASCTCFDGFNSRELHHLVTKAMTRASPEQALAVRIEPEWYLSRRGLVRMAHLFHVSSTQPRPHLTLLYDPAHDGWNTLD